MFVYFLDAFATVIPNIAMKFNNFDNLHFFGDILVLSSALDCRMVMEVHHAVFGFKSYVLHFH